MPELTDANTMTREECLRYLGGRSCTIGVEYHSGRLTVNPYRGRYGQQLAECHLPVWFLRKAVRELRARRDAKCQS